MLPNSSVAARARGRAPLGLGLTGESARWRALAMATTLLVQISAPAGASSELLPVGGTNGNVTASVVAGGTLYVGGYFDRAGPLTGSCIAVLPGGGELVAGPPTLAGPVRALVADGRGGWFVGGGFTAIDGAPHGALAHVDANGGVVAWDPKPDGDVLAMAVLGDTLFVGGAFNQIASIQRGYLAAFSVETGELLPALPAPNHLVRALLTHERRLYLGGDFDSLGGVSSGPVAACELDSWSSSTWTPHVPGSPTPGLFGRVNALAELGGELVVGGSISPGGCLAAFSTTTGDMSNWPPLVSGPIDMYLGGPEVFALAVQGSQLYLGGRFAVVGGIPRAGLAKVECPSGAVSAWDPRQGPSLMDVSRTVATILVSGEKVYLGGFFEIVGDSSRVGLAAVNAESGAPLAWEVAVGGAVSALSEFGGRLLVGGEFSGAGREWKEFRHGLAAFDLRTGALKPWNPGIQGAGVETLARIGGDICVGGYFSGLGGQPRYCLGAVDTLTGAPTSWDPSASGPIRRLRAIGDTLYVGGEFAALAGQPRAFVGRFEMSRGTLMPWAPVVDDWVLAFETLGDRVFLGGTFRTVNGALRGGLASVDLVTAGLDQFDPDVSGGVETLVACGDTLFVAGGFNRVGGQARSCIAAVHSTTGTVFDWKADTGPYVTSMIKDGPVLYVGGPFGQIGGEPRRFLAALSSATGTVLPWDAGLDFTVWGMSISDRMMFASGGFKTAFSHPRAGLLGIKFDAPAPPPSPPPTTLSFTDLWPNPASAQISAEFVAPSGSGLTVELFDIQGRLVSSATSGQLVTPGRNRIEIPVKGLREGLYLCRMEVGGLHVARKFMVVR